MEQIILDIWMKIFKSENITMEDDFYSLGGNSLIAARIAIQINNLFAAKLKLTDVLKHDTIPAIAKQIALQLHQEVT
jgi:acyl carrier protein